MRCQVLAVTVICLQTASIHAGGPVIDSMDQLRFQAPKDKGKAELVDGKFGKAVKFHLQAKSPGAFFTSNLRGKPAWDEAAGFSFWLKGDGSDHFGGLEFLYDDNYAVRYDYIFPLKSTEWTKITVAWDDLIPVLPGAASKPLDPDRGNRPSKLSALWFGRWWYWGDYPEQSFAIDEVRLEPKIKRDGNDYRPKGASLQRVLAKLKAGQPVSIVTMGDSLTDTKHWANREVSWPSLLRDRLQKKYQSKVTIHNPAIGGTQLRQNLVLMPRWLAKEPQPDLVTVCFGGNDWDAGMRGPQFRETCADAVDRIRRATGGKADVLLLTTVPSANRWGALAELAEACRKAAEERKAGLADTEKAFLKVGKADRNRLFVSDRVHLSRAGHELMAQTVQQAIEANAR